MREIALFGVMQLVALHAAILPPPWADPDRNPCALQPGGWLLVYWPPDGKCYRIFHRGHPCPETMELNPIQDSKNRTVAECRCPPRTAQNSTSNVCYPIHTRGPCERGEYFAPVRQSADGRKRIGRCVKAKQCRSEEVFWPVTSQCFPRFTKGPCSEGQLLVLNKETQLGECQCSSNGTLSKYYWRPTKTCHQHYTKGPCRERGSLFLPGPTCGCHHLLPNYDSVTKQCYEIGSVGPCKPGHRFDVSPPKAKASCTCKPEHVPWEDGQCYRLYTRGPCPPGEIVFGNNSCAPNPCPKGMLYFPETESCHRVGVNGPCPRGQLVLFEQDSRPSVEGVSYRGVCGCSGIEGCKTDDSETIQIAGRSSLNDGDDDDGGEPNRSTNGLGYLERNSFKIKICKKNEKPGSTDCHALYTQGPCEIGEWLVPARQPRTDPKVHRFGWTEAEPPLLFDEISNLKASCECRLGYNKSSNKRGCHLPLVTLANFLNGQDLFA